MDVFVNDAVNNAKNENRLEKQKRMIFHKINRILICFIKHTTDMKRNIESFGVCN